MTHNHTPVAEDESSPPSSYSLSADQSRRSGIWHDPYIRPVFALMLGFGILLGIILPLGVDPFVEWRPGAATTFHIFSLLGGACVGLLAFLLVRVTLYETTRRLAREATVDNLTGLLNHRFFHQQLGVELSKSTRHERPLSLAIIDIDNFKRVNDTHGHQAGDDVLRNIADLVRGQIRASDTPCRIGGEEIALILPDTSPEQALVVCERLRAAVEAHEFPVVGRITVSAGIAGFPNDAEDKSQLVGLADAAMYMAKQAGRNLTRIWEPAATADLGPG